MTWVWLLILSVLCVNSDLVPLLPQNQFCYSCDVLLYWQWIILWVSFALMRYEMLMDSERKMLRDKDILHSQLVSMSRTFNVFIFSVHHMDFDT